MHTKRLIQKLDCLTGKNDLIMFDYKILKNEKAIDLNTLIQIPDDFINLPDEEKIAVFDCDNTIIHGDISEAVFGLLKKKGYEMDFSWHEYNSLINDSNKEEAYKKLISCYSGKSKYTIEDITNQTINKYSDEIKFVSFTENGKFYSLPLPFKNSLMEKLILKLDMLGFNIYVISASSDISVKIVSREFFGIPKKNVHGMKLAEKDGLLTSRIIEPISCFEGKRDVYHEFISKNPPLITAGDSNNDLPLLELTSPKGTVLWMDKFEADEEKNNKSFENAKNKLNRDIIRIIPEEI